MKLYKLNSNSDVKSLFQNLGVTKEGSAILEQKSHLNFIYIKDLKSPAANILKQDALSIGADLAVPKETITCKNPLVDAILIANDKQLKELARKEKDNAGKKEETLMSNEQTKQPVTDKPAKKTMTDKLREDIEDAAWRSAARSSTKVVAEPLAALIAAKIDPDDSRMKEALIKFSESEYGKAFVAAAISMLLEAAPVKDKHAERAARFASELRKLAFEMSFTATADLALDPMMIVLRNFIMGKNVDLFENLMKELPESSILLDDVQTEESESKVDVKENVKLAQVSSEHERDPALGPF